MADKTENRRKQGAQPKWGKGLSELVKGSFLGGAGAVLFLLVCTGLISMEILPQKYMNLCIMAGCLCGTMLGGLLSAEKTLFRPWIGGTAVGACTWLLFLASGMLTCGTVRAGEGRGLQIFLVCLTGGLLSGMILEKRHKKSGNYEKLIEKRRKL